MMSHSAQILTTGGVILDSVISADGHVSLSQMGGNAVYSAVGASLWSDRVALAGNVTGNYPQQFLDRLMQAGISCDGLCRKADEVKETEWFLNAPDGSRRDHLYAPDSLFDECGFADPLTQAERSRFFALLQNHRPVGLTFDAFRALYPVTPDQAEAAAPAPGIVHPAPERLNAQTELARAFKARGALISLDPGHTGVEAPAGELASLLTQIDIFLPSEKEVKAILPSHSPAAALRELGLRTDAVLAIKMGARGAMLLNRANDRLLHIPVVPVAALDPVGAGDAFCGGFVSGYVPTRDPVEAAIRGTVSASFAVEGFGALHALSATAEEIARRRAAIDVSTIAERVQ